MEWKSYYRAECEAHGAREAIESWLLRDPDLELAIKRRAVISFPHTTLREAGPLQARVARALYEIPAVERVLALGVLHGSGLESYRRALDPGLAAAQRAAGFANVRGGFIGCPESEKTPFGPVEAWNPPLGDVIRVDNGGLLSAEFSLDTFRAVLRVSADALGRRPLPVCSIFVGMTRDPVAGSFAVAEEFGDWLRVHIDESTAVVATGDLVHYGTAYGGVWIDGNPATLGALTAALRPWVDRVLHAAFEDRDWEAAYALSRERLGNDQREMLAVLSSYLGPDAMASLAAFRLSDYSRILEVAPPCVVASALAVYRSAA